MAIFIPFKNVTTFYTNIFLEVFFCRKTLKKILAHSEGSTDRWHRSNSSLDEKINLVKILGSIQEGSIMKT